MVIQQSRRTFLKLGGVGIAAGAAFWAGHDLLSGKTDRTEAGSIAADAAGAGTNTAGTSPNTEALLPKKITSTQGSVTGANQILVGGEFTMAVSGGDIAQIVLDYGREVGGTPRFEVVAMSGSPIFTSIYSEALPWLLPSGDGPGPGKPSNTPVAPNEVSFVGNAGGANLDRSDIYSLTKSGWIADPLLQGGQRFQALQLAGSGSVTFRNVGIVPSFFIPSPSDNEGAFTSSDPALNEIWSLGSYAVQLCQIPKGAIPAVWTVSSAGTRIIGSEYQGYQGGAEWTDYTAAFDFNITSSEASWLVRGSWSDGVRFVVSAGDDGLPGAKPNGLHVYSQFTNQPLGEFSLPFPIDAGTWHHVQTTVANTTVTVVIDGTTIGQVSVAGVGGFPGVSAGWLAFGNFQGAEAMVRNVVVTDSGSNVLYRATMSDQSVLTDFGTSSNVLPSIVDGAKRDRLIYPGGAGLSGQTLLYTSFATEYLAGNIDLIAAFQLPSGATATALPPQYVPGKTPASAVGHAPASGLTDSIAAHITNIFNYWMYTGDANLLQGHWPGMKNVLVFLNSQLGSTGLIETGSLADTFTSARYYGALQNASQMALAVGDNVAVALYKGQAAALQAAINEQLFDATAGLYLEYASLPGVYDEQGNALCVLNGIVPVEIRSALLAKLYDVLDSPAGPMQATSFAPSLGTFSATSWDVLARLSAGDTLTALDIIRTAWGHMREGSDYYTGATWEYVAPDGTPGLGSGTSLAQGAASGPTTGLSRYVLGVQPITPGYRTWLLEPQLGDLEWAKGTVPTPHGAIHISWAIEPSGSLSVRFTVPAGTSVTVGVPTQGRSSVVLDGTEHPIQTLATSLGSSFNGYSYISDVLPGNHEIVVG